MSETIRTPKLYTIYTIGEPPQLPDAWLEDFSRSCEVEAHHSILPWTRARLFARAAAFREAADLVRRAMRTPQRPTIEFF